MPSIRITQFAGLLPEVNAKALRNDHAQIAHNCLLWDGWLRPMPVWTEVTTYGSQPLSLMPLTNVTNGFFDSEVVSQGIFENHEPFSVSFVGLDGASRLSKVDSLTTPYLLGIPIPTLALFTQTVTGMFLSTYPIPRTYAITYLSNNSEGPPVILPQLGANGDLFEGDIVNLDFTFNPIPLINRKITGFRIYRTVPSFDTSEQLGNPLETGFHLVTEVLFPGFFITHNTYADVLSSEKIPGDLLLTDQFMPPPTFANFLDKTESGWLVATANSSLPGDAAHIQVSERYLWDAWPPQNTVLLNESIQDIAVFYDDVFFGTSARPYHMRVEQGDSDALNLIIRPFTDDYACVPNTMVTTNFGALYASKDGLVALETDGDKVVSKKVTNPGDQLGGQSIRMDNALNAIWWNGSYFGLCNGVGYVFNLPNGANNEFPLAQLVTIDTPEGLPGANIVTGSGLFSLWGNTLYTFPLPGYGYESADKLTYTWKSKVYVLAGLTTFSAAKVVNNESGALNFTLIGDGQVIISRPVTHSNPFRLPHQHKCTEWQIIVTGKAVIQEIHVATSIRDLTEEPGNG